MRCSTRGPTSSLAIADTELVAADGTRKPSARVGFALEGTERENVAALLEAPIDNSRVYGALPARGARAGDPDEEFFAMDWAIAHRDAARGRATRSPPGATLVRTDSDTEKYLRLIEVLHAARARARSSGSGPFTRYLLRAPAPAAVGRRRSSTSCA